MNYIADNPCNLCPRHCNADRSDGHAGYCGVPRDIYIARAALHFWEEPCISGDSGSGAVFFSGCTLRCVYCQNYELAHAAKGEKITKDRLVEIFLELQEQGAGNINLVTPDQYMPELREAMIKARSMGLTIPYVINCSGYETEEQLSYMDGVADIYLTDFKYMDDEKAARYSGARDYPEVAKKALDIMVQQVGEPEFGDEGLMKKGVIVRHLLIPGMVHNGKKVVRYVYETYHDKVYLSLMHQFTPFERLSRDYPEIDRTVTKREYDSLVNYALEMGVTKAFIQEKGAAKESFIPEFDGTGI